MYLTEFCGFSHRWQGVYLQAGGPRWVLTTLGRTRRCGSAWVSWHTCTTKSLMGVSCLLLNWIKVWHQNLWNRSTVFCCTVLHFILLNSWWLWAIMCEALSFIVGKACQTWRGVSLATEQDLYITDWRNCIMQQQNTTTISEWAF